MISDRDRQIALNLKQLMLDRSLPICEVIVFGSRARGNADPDSDLDVLVIVSHRDREIREAIRSCAWEVGFEEGLFIQTVVLTQDEVTNSPERSSLLMIAVQREGIPV
jgi:predicted nucleotidyltransferase